MKRLTYMVGAASFLAQMKSAQELFTRLHNISIECGAEWDGHDGYAFTDAQYKRYTRELKNLGIRTDSDLGGHAAWADILMQGEKVEDNGNTD